MATLVQDDDARIIGAFTLKVPMEGSQVYLSWTANALLSKIQIRRKVGGAPTSETDGELVVEFNPALPANTSYLDRTNLIPVGREFQWWDYRAFCLPIATPDWLTADNLTDAALVFRTGRHFDVITQQRHIPEFFLVNDNEQLRSLVESATPTQVVNLGETGADTYGPLRRVLRVLCFELDRVHSHLKSLAEVPDIMLAPSHALQEIAAALGFAVDANGDLQEARAVIESLVGIYKRVGTSSLIELIGAAELGVVPRVQEMSAFVMIAANPDLWRA